MQHLRAYGGGGAAAAGAGPAQPRVTAAPPVAVREVGSLSCARLRRAHRSRRAQLEGDLLGRGDLALYHNPRHDALAAPLQGPLKPFRLATTAHRCRRCLTGWAAPRWACT